MSGIATAIVGGAVIGAGASYFASKSSSDAAGDAADVQSESNLAATEMQLEYLRETRADIADAVEKGLIDLETGFNMAIQGLTPEGGFDAISNYANLIKDPSAVFDRPGVQFQYEQGVEALQAGFSRTAGGGLSGPIVKAAQEYGQNFASLALDKELARLGPLMDVQKSVAGLQVGKGGAMANLRVGGATGTAQVSGPIVGDIAAGTRQQGNIAASGLINQANIQSGLISNIASQGTDLTTMFALRPELFSGGATAPTSTYIPPGSGYTPSR